MKRKSIFLQKPVWAALCKHAEQQDRPTSELVRSILSAWLDDKEDKLKKEKE